MTRRSPLLLLLMACVACGGGSADPTAAGGTGGTAATGGTAGTGGGSASGGSAGASAPEPYFGTPDLGGIELVGIPASEITFEGDVVKCKCTGNGYLYKNGTYRNFILTLDFRFERPPALAPGDDASFNGNAGYFVYLSPPHQIWPSCLEVQGGYQETGDIFQLPGLLPGNDTFDTAALASARKLVGEWNTLVITSAEGSLTVELNGIQVNQSTPTDLSEGIIALESEGAEVHWRNVMIQKLP